MDFLGAIVAPMAASLIALMASLLIQPVVSLMLNAITRKGQEWISSIICITFNDEGIGQRIQKSRKRI